MLAKLLRWISRGKFRPGVVEFRAARVTEMVIEDALIVYRPLRIPGVDGACVDLGYSSDGRLIAIKVWGLVGRVPNNHS